MKRHKFVIKVLGILFLLYQTSCAIPASTGNLSVTSTMQSPVKLKITKLHEWSFPGQDVLDIEWASHSDGFVVVTSEKTIMYDVDTYQELWSISPIAPAYNASVAVFSPNGQTITLYIRLAGLQIRDATSGGLLLESRHNNYPGKSDCLPLEAFHAVLAPQQTLFLSVEDYHLKGAIFTEVNVWDLSSLQCKETFLRTEGHARSLDLSTDGRFLALSVGVNTRSGSNETIEDGQITVWNRETRRRACSIGHQGSVAHFKPGSSLLLVSDPKNKQLAYWDVQTCQIVGTLSGIAARYNFAFSPDGQWIAVWENGIWILDANSGKALNRIDDPAPDHVDDIMRFYSTLTFSPNGKFLLYEVRQEPIRGKIFLWNLER